VCLRLPALFRWITALCLVGLVVGTQEVRSGTQQSTQFVLRTHSIEGRIVGVQDGDSTTLLDAGNRQHKIRLDGVDAPEKRATVRASIKAAPGRAAGQP